MRGSDGPRPSCHLCGTWEMPPLTGMRPCSFAVVVLGMVSVILEITHDKILVGQQANVYG